MLVAALLLTLGRPGVITSAEAAARASYEYIVVGGGTAGLTVAGRLSQAGHSVLVVEAGDDNRDDEQIYNLQEYWKFFTPGSPYNWQYPTPGWNGVTTTVPAGKTLGGSSSINGATWTWGSAAQYDALAQLGNDPSVWSADRLAAARQRAEAFTSPDAAQAAAGCDSVSSAHGKAGPVHTSFAPADCSTQDCTYASQYTGPIEEAFAKAAHGRFGLERLADLTTGQPNGVAMNALSLNAEEQHKRSSAATGYPPLGNESLLTLLVSARGVQVAWADGDAGDLAALGVVVQQQRGGALTTINASREVVVAAGTLQSPGFLERSGIGDPSVLGQLGVRTRRALPGVGKNLVEELINGVGAPVKADYGGKGPSNMIAYPNLRQIMSNATDVRAYVERSYATWAAEAVAAGAAASSDALIAVWNVTTSLIFDHATPVVEWFCNSGFPREAAPDAAFGVMSWYLQPYSRGFAHAASADAFDAPHVDPRYLSTPIDLDIHVAGLRGARRLMEAEPLRSLIAASEKGEESVPGFAAVPNDANGGKYEDWVRFMRTWTGDGATGSVGHQIGTCAMAREDLGGVVDSDLRVYGTRNVRVVDASVLPFSVSAHNQSTVYAIAETAAERILQLVHPELGAVTQASRGGKV